MWNANMIVKKSLTQPPNELTFDRINPVVGAKDLLVDRSLTGPRIFQPTHVKEKHFTRNDNVLRHTQQLAIAPKAGRGCDIVQHNTLQT